MSDKKTFKERILSEEYRDLDYFIGMAMTLLSLYFFTKWEWVEILLYITGCAIGLVWIVRQFYFIFKKRPASLKTKEKQT